MDEPWSIPETQRLSQTPDLVASQHDAVATEPSGDSNRLDMATVRRMQLSLRTALAKKYAGDLSMLRKEHEQSEKKRNDATWKWAWRKYSEYFQDRFMIRLSIDDRDYVLNYMWHCGRTAHWKKEVLDVDMEEVKALFAERQWTDALCRAAVHCEEYLDDLANRALEGTAELPKPRVKRPGSATPKSKKGRLVSETRELVIEHAYTVCEDAEESQAMMPSYSVVARRYREEVTEGAKKKLKRACRQSDDEIEEIEISDS